MLNFKEVYINAHFTVVGPEERAADLKNADIYLDDYYYGEKTIENAEVKMQKVVLNNLTKLYKPNLVVGGELSHELAITSMNLQDRGIPFLGLFSACAVSAEGLIVLGNFITNRAIKEGILITSAHNLTVEKTFRFPIEYGAPKPIRSSFTATGAVGISVSNKPSNLKLVNGTIGAIVDSGIKDALNMGAVMAPSTVDTLIEHLKNSKTTVSDYDLIMTGDLGKVGTDIFKELLQKNHNIKLTNHLDGGMNLYKNDEYSGASGPIVAPLILFTKVLPNKKYKKILYLATGALMSPNLVNQKNSIPAVTHAVTLEVLA